LPLPTFASPLTIPASISAVVSLTHHSSSIPLYYQAKLSLPWSYSPHPGLVPFTSRDT
jgi:hypothetical protein